MEPATTISETLIPQWIPEQVFRSDHYSQGKIDVTWNPMSQEKQKIWSTGVSNDIQFFFTPGGYSDPTQWAIVMDIQLAQFNYCGGGNAGVALAPVSAQIGVPNNAYSTNNIVSQNQAGNLADGALGQTAVIQGDVDSVFVAPNRQTAAALEYAIQAHHILQNPLLLFRNATLMINNIQFEYVVNPMKTFQIFKAGDGSLDWSDYMDDLMGGYTPRIPLPIAPVVAGCPRMGWPGPANDNTMAQYKSLPQFRIPDTRYRQVKNYLNRQLNIVSEGDTDLQEPPIVDPFNGADIAAGTNATNTTPFRRFQVIIPLAAIFGFCQTSKYIPPSNTVSVRLQKEPLLQEYIKVWGLGFYKTIGASGDPTVANNMALNAAGNVFRGVTLTNYAAAPSLLNAVSHIMPIDYTNVRGVTNLIGPNNIPLQGVNPLQTNTWIGLEPLFLPNQATNSTYYGGLPHYPFHPINALCTSEPDVYLWDIYMRVFNFTPLERDKQTVEDAERAAANNITVPFYRMSQLGYQQHSGYGQAPTFTISVTFRPVAIYILFSNQSPKNKYMSGDTLLQTNIEQINCTVAGQLCNQNVMSWVGIPDYSALYSYKNLLDGRGYHYGDYDQRKPMPFNVYKDLHCVYYFNCDNITKKAEQDGTFNYVVDIQFRYPGGQTNATRPLDCLIYAEYEDSYGYVYENNVLKLVKQKSS